MKFYQKIRRGNERIITVFGIKFKYSRKSNSAILHNIFNTHYKKRILLSYITYPFVKGVDRKHTNRLECYTAAEIFNELGYQVDVVDYNVPVSSADVKDYCFVYGFGKAFSMAVTNPKIKTIFYGTGCCSKYSNLVTIQKIIDFYNSHGAWAPMSARISDMASEIALNFSDLIIPLGNEFVASTYRLPNIKQNIQNLNCFYYDTYDIDITQKNFDTIKNNFLWFGSLGALHKGLDIVIDVFKKRPDLNLTIAGANLREQEFYEYYKDVFDGKIPNIKYYDFVDIESQLFKDLMNNHVAVVFPSVSEGGAPAVLNVMANGGLIPIISNSCGLDVAQYGFSFDNIDIDTVENKIDQLISLESIELQKLSEKIKTETRNLYTYDNYKGNLRKIISSLL